MSKLIDELKGITVKKRVLNEQDITDRISRLLDRPTTLECKNCASHCCIMCSKCLGHYMYKGVMLYTLLKKDIPECVLEQLKLFQDEYRWTDKNGFYLNQQGCSLPREFRSVICQRSNCEKVERHLSDKEKKELVMCLKDLKEVREVAGILV